MRFRKKPVVIEALQVGIVLVAAETEFDTLPQWIRDAYSRGDIVFGQTTIKVLTPEGRMVGNSTDWLIRGVKGEIYPCRNDIFEETYERAD